MMRQAQDMDVFKLSHSLTIEIYKLTEKFPPEEEIWNIYSTNATVCIYLYPLNIAEGASRLGIRRNIDSL